MTDKATCRGWIIYHNDTFKPLVKTEKHMKANWGDQQRTTLERSRLEHGSVTGRLKGTVVSYGMWLGPVNGRRVCFSAELAHDPNGWMDKSRWASHHMTGIAGPNELKALSDHMNYSGCYLRSVHRQCIAWRGPTERPDWKRQHLFATLDL